MRDSEVDWHSRLPRRCPFGHDLVLLLVLKFHIILGLLSKHSCHCNVCAGTLVALERPASYQERRTDGYREPLHLYLVGTAHVSAQSAEDVRAVVRAVQPDAVVVELCRSRQAVMYPPQQAGQGSQEQPGKGTAQASPWTLSGSMSEGEEQQEASGSFRSVSCGDGGSTAAAAAPMARNLLSLSGGSLLSSFQRSMELGGSSALLLRLLLGRMSAGLSGRLGVTGGGEFVAARQEAEALGAQLVLGDRPIEITLQRAWDALSWRRRAALAAELARGAWAARAATLDAAAVERLKDDDAVSLLFAQLSAAYPEVGLAGWAARALASIMPYCTIDTGTSLLVAPDLRRSPSHTPPPPV